jgi:hypothetical protein
VAHVMCPGDVYGVQRTFVAHPLALLVLPWTHSCDPCPCLFSRDMPCCGVLICGPSVCACCAGWLLHLACAGSGREDLELLHTTLAAMLTVRGGGGRPRT